METLITLFAYWLSIIAQVFSNPFNHEYWCSRCKTRPGGATGRAAGHPRHSMNP